MTQECLSRLPVVSTCTALEIWRIIFSCHKTRQDWSHLFNRGGEMKHPAGYGIDLPNTELSHPKCQQLYHWQTWVQRLILVPFAAVAPACDLLAYSHPPIPVAFHSQVSVVTCHIYLAPVPCPTWCVHLEMPFPDQPEGHNAPFKTYTPSTALQHLGVHTMDYKPFKDRKCVFCNFCFPKHPGKPRLHKRSSKKVCYMNTQ